MGDTPFPSAAPAPRLRLWPAVVILVLEWAVLLIPGWVAPVTMAHMFGSFLAPMAAGLGLCIWWLFASRLPWRDRWLGLWAFAVSMLAMVFLSHPTVGGFGLIFLGLPWATTAWVGWLVLTFFLPWHVRRAGLVVVLVLTFGVFLLVRNEGVTGDFSPNLHFRWTPSDEDLFLADVSAGKLKASKEAAAATAPIALQPGDWPAFRGPARDGVLSGVRIFADWQASPPRQVWKHRIGPGWSSFAVIGNRLFTQEQRGADEAVVCYDADSGAEIWAHQDTARFSEAMAGPGPRATPTFHEGKLYTQGATGKLNCLEAATGKKIWSRDVMDDTKAPLPTWGFAASPLVTHGVVMTFAGGPDGKSMIAYDAATGEPRWTAGEGQFSYCSPHPVRLDGVEQVLLATDRGLTAYDPGKGTVLWERKWPIGQGMARVVQPARVGDSDFLLGTSFGYGTQRFNVNQSSDGWAARDGWTSTAIKPYYNDLVVHKGHVYGFDNTFFTCISLADGKALWRARGYGAGQVLLLPDQDLLVILGEKGQVALVDAVPDGHHERARFQAITGKTWNHPVIARGRLYVRNGDEAACYELAAPPTADVAPGSQGDDGD